MPNVYILQPIEDWLNDIVETTDALFRKPNKNTNVDEDEILDTPDASSTPTAMPGVPTKRLSGRWNDSSYFIVVS